MNIEVVYYKLYGREEFQSLLEKAEKSSTLSKNELCVSSIEENNKAFLEHLEHIIPKDYEYIDFWLRGLISDYVKRKSRQKGDTPYFQKYYDSWLNNTRLIVNGKYPIIEKWCNEYEIFLKNKNEMKKRDTTTNSQKIPKSNGAVPKPSPLPPSRKK